MSLPSAVHVFSIIKCEASGDWEARYSVVFQIGSFAKYVYMCISVLYSLFWLLFVFYFVQKKKEEVEMRVVIAKRAGRTKSVSYLCFPLISDER